MPDDKDPGVTPEKGEMPEKTPEEILAELPEDQRKLFEDANKGLVSALNKERDARKEAEKQLAGQGELKKKAEAYDKLKDEELSEVEKAKKEAAEALAAKEAAEQKLANSQFESKVIAAAAKLKFFDPKDVVTMIPKDAEDIEASVQELAKAKPYLIDSGNRKNNPQLPANNPDGAGDKKNETDADRRNRIYGFGSGSITNAPGAGVYYTPGSKEKLTGE